MDRTPDKSLVWAFPTPDTPLLAVAYRDLYLAAEGTAQQKEMLGDPALLPRPWDPATCQDPLLRQEVWDWLEEFVVWFNREYVWDPNAGMIPSCWPQHPHLVHEIAVLPTNAGVPASRPPATCSRTGTATPSPPSSTG